MKTEAEINAEKAAKPRPDLVPAAAVLRVCWCYSPDDDPAPAIEHVIDAWRCVLQFRDTCDPMMLAEAAESVVHALAVDDYITNPDAALPHAMLSAGRVMGYGFRKHGNCTWRVAGSEQADPQTHIASAERHLLEYLVFPGATEEGSGQPVLYHALAQLCITLHLVLDPPKLVGANDGHGTVTGRCAP